MDIVIKSFNRAYLLDRAIFSLYKHVKSGLGNIIILDDGTPEVYLSRLQEKHEDIIIEYSPNYKLKITGQKAAAPIQFWKSEINKCSKYILVLEDDIWLNQMIDLTYLESFLESQDIALFKLKWWGNPKMVQGKFNPMTPEGFGIIDTQLRPFSEVLVKNRYYLNSMANILKVIPKDYFLSLYTLYDVAGQIFNKDYYNYVWPNDQYAIEEMIQLGKAAEYYRKNNEKKVGRSNVEYTTTTFCSSSTGNSESLGFDMNDLNNQLNKSWLDEKFNALDNFPSDFTLNYIKNYLVDWDDVNINNWIKWSVDWRKHFINMGSDLSKYNNINELK